MVPLYSDIDCAPKEDCGITVAQLCRRVSLESLHVKLHALQPVLSNLQGAVMSFARLDVTVDGNVHKRVCRMTHSG